MDYIKVYNSIVNNRKENVLNTSEYTEIHHIVPRCMGGTDNSDNLIKVYPREHYVLHELLIKIYPSNPKLWYAWNMMSNMSNTKRVYKKQSSRLYSQMRKEYHILMSRKYKIENEEHTIKEWIELNGLHISISSMRERLRNGWDIVKALTKDRTKYRLFTFNGKTMTLSEWSIETNIPYSRLQYRIKNGWSIEDALTTEKQKCQVYFYKNKWKTIGEWSDELKLSRGALWRNLQKTNDFSKAVEITMQNKVKTYLFNGKMLCLSEIAKISGVVYSTLITRLARGESIEYATSY